jgi:hypothetical protein
VLPGLTGLAVNVTGVPGQTDVPGFATILTDGVIEGSTVILKFCGVPEQPLAVGVTVIFDIVLLPVVLVAVKAIISPVPLADNAVEVLSFTQL